ncbi:MAG TPA: UDP-N-acetylmuramate dehydrogenase [Acidimicrobiales bacterium]|nr:UDP-N-acetylmuramate dehydrogenase [Acidimicrobiales bacterium]
MADPAVRPAGHPGHADPDAVAKALQLLAPLAGRAEPGGALGPITTYRVGGAAAVRVTVASPSELAIVADAVVAAALPVLVVGRGSNLLVAESGFGGIAVVLDPSGFEAISVKGTTATAGAAVPLPALARQTVEAGLTGFEWAVGVPGSVGGAVRMNAGGHGSDIAHSLVWCRVVDLTRPAGPAATLGCDELHFAYRHSSITAGQIVTEAAFGLAPGDREAGRETIRQIVRWRREHQPGGQNAGSVFTNPPDDSAGRLIDTAGLKGRRRGSAMVSPKHANFIQADPAGSADDVRALIEEVQAEVEKVHGVLLTPEVRMIGFAHNPHVQVESREVGGE